MGFKKRNSYALNWATTLNAGPWNPNTPASGNPNGAMSGTNTIYSQVMDLANIDNAGAIVTWTGTPTGTISVLVSELGDVFYPLTFNPALTQPTGSAGGYAINLNQLPWRFFAIQYTNASGSGTLTVSLGTKDLN